MPELTITIPGAPKPQGRPRFVRHGAFVSTYDPSAKDKKRIRDIAATQIKAPLEGPLSLNARFYMPISKGTSKKKSAAMEGEPMVKAIDLDNMVKECTDALNGLAYADDKQIWHIEAEKVYSHDPRTVLAFRTDGRAPSLAQVALSLMASADVPPSDDNAT